MLTFFSPTLGSGRNMAQNSSTLGGGTRLNIYTNILNLGNKQGAVSSKKLIYADNFIKAGVTP